MALQPSPSIEAKAPRGAAPGARSQSAKGGIPLPDLSGVREQLRICARRGANSAEVRSQVLTLLRDAHKAGREAILEAFKETRDGRKATRRLSQLADQIVRLACQHAAEDLYPLGNPSKAEKLTLVAVGGYGRGELAPFSDVDLLFLLPYKITPRSEQVVEAVLYLLWDMGFKVGHATRSLNDCLRRARNDHTIATNLLETRYLWGEETLYNEFKERYRKEVAEGRGDWFIEAKLAERDRRHQRHAEGSRYALEPNIKESKGGLRDLHTLYWIGKFLYGAEEPKDLIEAGVLTKEEARRFDKALNFLWTLRCWMHVMTGRAEERLTFDLQQNLAPLLGFNDHAGTRAVERLMKRYFLVAKEVGNLTRIFCAQLEAEHNRRSRFRLPRTAIRGLPSLGRRRRVRGFGLEGDRLQVKDAEHFQNNPIDLLRIFLVAQEEELDIHPATLRLITQNLKLIDKDLRANPKACQVFLDILDNKKNPAVTLRRMNEAGVFGKFMPDFGRVVCLMQFNMYHHFTVDEHTIRAIGTLHAIEAGELAEEAPIATEVVHRIHYRRALYFAVLLHDIAKGRPEDHSIAGMKLARRLGPKMGLSAEETEAAAWLVLHHLAMSDTAFKRDLDDPNTIAQFAKLVQSLERLRLLLVLTVADIRAVGPGVWTNWKAALLRDLFWRTEEFLTGGLLHEGREKRIEGVKARLGERLEGQGWQAGDIQAHLARGYPAYWLSGDIDLLVGQAEIVRDAERNRRPLSIHSRIDQYRGVTEITVYTADHPGLFSQIAGAIAVAGATVEGARIATLVNGMALDTFYIEDAGGGPFDSPTRLAKLSTLIERALSGQLRMIAELSKQTSPLPSRFAVFKVAPHVLIDNKASRHYTVIEVNGRDSPGLLYRVTLALSKLGLGIHGAKIATFGAEVVDVFYVQDVFGDKIEAPAKQRAIRKRLLTALAESQAAGKA